MPTKAFFAVWAISGAHCLIVPADALWPSVITAFAGSDQVADTGDVVLHPGAARRLKTDVVDRTVAAADIHEGSALGHGIDRREESRHDLRLSGQRIGWMNAYKGV